MKARLWIIGVLAFGGIVVTVMVLYVILNAAQDTDKISNTQDTSVAENTAQSQTLKEVRSLARDIRSCTTPGEECAERGQAATAKAVGDIAQAQTASSAAAAACAVQLQDQGRKVTFQNVYTCITKTLEAQKRLSRAGQSPAPSP